jgi:long-chain fatty acid transport protein
MRWSNVPLSVLVLLSCYTTVHGQTGHVVHGVGAINQSMAGAGTAMPLDATGALFWNPGSITDLKSSEVDINVDVGLLHSSLSSSLQPNALAPGFPSRTISGSSETDARRAFAGSIGWVHRSNLSKWTFGLLAVTPGGFGFKYKNNGQNPITTPQPPNGFGVGEIRTNYSLIQVAPSFAFAINDRLSAGISPSLGFASLEVDPFPFTSPDDANRDGFPTYPQSDRPKAVGAGIQGGLYYKMSDWQLGVSVKSPQWFRSFEFESRDEAGRPRSFKFTVNYPTIIAAGVGYSGSTRLRWAADARYIDYQNTKGFARTGFNAQTGAVEGVGWQSIWVVASGAEFRLSDRLSLRGGYGFNENPIRHRDTFFNLGSPLITQHQVNAGLSYSVNEGVTTSFAFHHAFKNDVQGQYQSPSGPIPGSSIRSDFGTDIVVLSLNLKF